jgi:hypothetical protein
VTPKERVRAACARWGEAEVVRDCVTVLRGGRYPSDEKWLLLGGPAAPSQLKSPANAYWAHVWVTRVLLYAWRDEAAPAVIAALAHPAWRVREMAAKVCALREIGGDALAPLLADPVPRVRAAAARALDKLAARLDRPLQIGREQ